MTHCKHIAAITAKMKSVQRKFGTLMKRSENEADIASVMAEFKAVDEMLDSVRIGI